MKDESVVDQIKELTNNANSIISLFLQKIPKWKNESKHYDKVGWGFNIDNRFSSCEGINITFDSYMGTYGDSGCSRECHLDKNIFNSHLLKYLNDNKESIMIAIADSIRKEAIGLKEGAENELLQQLEKIRELK